MLNEPEGKCLKPFQRNNKVVPKLVFTLSRRICNAIYRNSDKAHVFSSSLSFQQSLVMSGLIDYVEIIDHRKLIIQVS